MNYRTVQRGMRIAEVPIRFEERTDGVSKMSLGADRVGPDAVEAAVLALLAVAEFVQAGVVDAEVVRDLVHHRDVHLVDDVLDSSRRSAGSGCGRW